MLFPHLRFIRASIVSAVLLSSERRHGRRSTGAEVLPVKCVPASCSMAKMILYLLFLYFLLFATPRVPRRHGFSFIVNRCNDFSGRLNDRVRTCPRRHCQLGPWRQLTRSLFRLCLPDLADSIPSLFGWHLAYLQEYKEKCTWVSGEK